MDGSTDGLMRLFWTSEHDRDTIWCLLSGALRTDGLTDELMHGRTDQRMDMPSQSVASRRHLSRTFDVWHYFELENEIDFPKNFLAKVKGFRSIQRYLCWRLNSIFCHHKSWLYPPPPRPVWTTPSHSHVLKYSVNKSFTNHSRLPQRREKKP